MTVPPAPPLHLTATRIAEYFRYGCERQLRYEMVPSELRGSNGVPVPNHDPARGPLVGPRPGSKLLLEAGRRWERRKLRQLLGRMDAGSVLIGGWTEEGDPERIPTERVVRALREPGDLEILVQPELRLRDTDEFAHRWGIDPNSIDLAPAAPDLVRLRRNRRGDLRLQIVDIKASREARTSHLAQIAFYTLLLEELCEQEGITHAAVDIRWGRVWSRGTRRPARFPLQAYRHHVARFLRDELPCIARTTPGDSAWHLSSRCVGCGYFELCRHEADAGDDLGRVVGLTRHGRNVLRTKGVRTVRQLARSHRRDTFTGSHSLAAQSSQLQRRAQAMSYGKVIDLDRSGTHLMGVSEDVRVIVSAEGDPVTGLCFALGIRVEDTSGRPARSHSLVSIAGAGTRAAEREMLGHALAELGQILEHAGSPNDSRNVRAPSVHFFVYDRTELELLRDLLQRNLHRPEMQSVLRPLFSRVAGGGTGSPAATRSAPGTILVDAITALFALPIPYVYDLASASRCLSPERDPHQYAPPEDHSRPLSSQVAFERIHEVWQDQNGGGEGRDGQAARARESIRQTVLSKVAAIDSVIRGVRERASRGDRLKLRPGPLSTDAESPIDQPLLESLRIVTEMEAAAEDAALSTLHALPAVGRALRFECIRGMHLVERRTDGTLVFEFDPACRDVKFRRGDFNLVLTNDDGRSLMETDRLPWKRWPLLVELVDFELSSERPRVVLAPSSGLAKAEAEGWIDLERQCVLDRAPSDFNTRRVVATLRGLATTEAGHITGLLSGKVPEDWVAQYTSSDSVLAETVRASALNRDQERAWRASFEQPVTVIWGPPGTGKTYLLGWILIGLAAAARREGKPCRILVTASTHRAIVNVLSRVSQQLEAARVPLPLRLVKLRGSGSEAHADLDGTRVDVVADDGLERYLDDAEASGESIVVGSTVWSLWKQMRAGEPDDAADGSSSVPGRPLFDVVVIDEASQMKVPEALIALSAMRSSGQVIACGDDRQLAPVIRGGYDQVVGDARSLVGSVFEHLAGHFPRLALRETRRMNEALVDYPKRLFYPGLVSVCPQRRIRVAGLTGEVDPIADRVREAFLDPTDAVVFCTYGGVQATARNGFEAGLAARIASLTRDLLIDPETGDRYGARRFVSSGLAIISPHRAQNSAILAELLGAGFPVDGLPVVDTVERMQGNERDVIIVSYAVADREYAENEAEFLLNPNRFNVSITRPRSKLIVLMSEEILRVIPRDEVVLTGSVAVQGYRDHCCDGHREVELPDGEGGQVRMRCHYRRLASQSTGAGERVDRPR